MTPSNKLVFEKEEFTTSIKNCFSLRDVCEHYKKPINGYYTKLFTQWINTFECDTSHFSNKKVTLKCIECESPFEVNPSKASERKFCSLKCANQKVRGRALPLPEDELVGERKHRAICFRYHKKECVVCKEKIAVTVHHYNENHSDDTPSNLVPICANHHIYLHSNEGRHLVIDTVNDYVTEFCKTRGYSVIG